MEWNVCGQVKYEDDPLWNATTIHTIEFKKKKLHFFFLEKNTPPKNFEPLLL